MRSPRSARNFADEELRAARPRRTRWPRSTAHGGESNSRFRFLLARFLLSFRQQVAEAKPLTQYFFADTTCDPRLEDRAVENVGVEFTVLAARVHTGRQIGEEGCVQFTPRERRIEYARIDTHSDC